MNRAEAAAGAQRKPGAVFVTVEGIDGVGKSSHLDAMAQWLDGHGHRVCRSREPGGTPLAETLRGLFLSQPMGLHSEALLAFGARADHLERVIRPALADGQTVLCDRFTDATFAYQGGGRGADWVALQALERWVHPDLQPDLTLWFDAAPETAAARRAGARAADRLEAEDLAFFERVRAGYRRRQAEAPQRIVRIDATPAPEAVWAQVAAVLAERIPSAGRAALPAAG